MPRLAAIAGRTLRTLFAATVLAIGCGKEGNRDRHPSTLTVLYPVDERSWAFYVPSQFLVFPPLTVRGRDGRMHGWLAQSWEISADWRTYTVRLRSGVRWHDGQPVTAEDARFTLELLANPDVAGEAPNAYLVRVIDDTTFTLTFRQQPSEYWLYYDPIYPKHLLQKLDPKKFYDWEFWTHPVGSGPFRYVRHVPKTMMEFEANPVIWNHRNRLFADPAVRRALTLAVDRRALLETLNLPAEVPTFDVLFTHTQFYGGEFPSGMSYDPRRASKLLDSLGWRDTDGDGVRDRHGKQFRFSVLVQPGQSFANAAVFIQSQLRAVGVTMDIVTLEAKAVAVRVRKGNFDASIGPVNNALTGDGGHRDYFGSTSRIGYRNARVATLLDSAAAAFDPREIERFYRELMPIFQAELPVTLLYPLVRTTVVHRRVRGLSSPYRDDPLWYAGELWLEDRANTNKPLATVGHTAFQRRMP